MAVAIVTLCNFALRLGSSGSRSNGSSCGSITAVTSMSSSGGGDGQMIGGPIPGSGCGSGVLPYLLYLIN